jgi:two-component system cell cycle response regulator
MRRARAVPFRAEPGTPGEGQQVNHSRRRPSGAKGEGRAPSAAEATPGAAEPASGPSATEREPRASAGLVEHVASLARSARSLHARAWALADGRHGALPPVLAHALGLAEQDALAVASAAEAMLEALRADPGLATRLPLPADAAADTAARPRLLVCEDDPEHREALADALGRDYEVEALGCGEETVAAAVAAPPDVLLLDLRVPGLGGLEVLGALRAGPATADVPVILLTGHADDGTRVRALELGAVDILQKPVSLRELRARIERTLQLARRHSQLRAMAQTDVLTGLANLRAFRSRLEDEVRRARRYGTPLTCLMADMDHLKPVNDEMGHAAGDLALAAMADVMRTELRATDLGARYGGDEFVLLLPHTTAAEGLVLAERVCARLRETRLEVGGRTVPLRASFGVAELAGGPTSETADDLVRRADEALYAAKRAGRGQAVAHAGSRGLPLPPPGPALTA